MAQILMPYPTEKESTLDKLVKIATVAKAGGDIYKDVSDISSKAALESQKKDPTSPLNQGFQKSVQGTPYQGRTIYDLEKSGNLTGANDFLKQTAEQAVKASAPMSPETQLEKGFVQVDPGTKNAIAAPAYDPVTKQSSVNWYVKKDKPIEALESQYKALQIEQEKSKVNQANANSVYNTLSKPDQIQVDDIAKDIGTKTSINNEIKAGLAILRDPKISEDQKVVRAENMAKLLNSTQGKDAVGAEEAKRLLGFVQFKKFNLTEPGSVFGRDMDEFANQVEITSNQLDDAVSRQQNALSRFGISSASKNSNAPVSNSPNSATQSNAPTVPGALRGLSANAPQVKVIDGVTYDKILGGWKARTQ